MGYVTLVILAALLALVEHAVSQNGNPMPENYQVRVNVEGQQMLLNLTRTSQINDTAPVILGKRGYMTVWDDSTARQTLGVYTDPSNAASFVIRDVVEGQTTKREMRGIFHHGGEGYTLEPLASSSSQTGGDVPPGYSYQPIEETIHVVGKGKGVPEDFSFDAVTRANITEFTKDMEERVRLAEESGHAPPGKQNYQVESHVFLDYAIFSKWYRASSAIHPVNRENEAINNIRFYYTHIMNGVNMRYATIDDPAFSIRVKLTGFYIAMTSYDAPWTEQHSELGEYTEAYDALDHFEEWINDQANSLPPFDQATLFTGYKLFSGTKVDGSRRVIAGLADIKGICMYTRASINRDYGQYANVQTAAHEIGHNLGANHDGLDNSCTGRDQYIMASAPGVLTDRNFNNAFKFSYCSINQFRTFLWFLTMEKRNCLLQSTSGTELTPDWWNHLRGQPGQRFSPDEQCQNILGDSSLYCAGGPRDEQICHQMSCWEPRMRKCTAATEQRAAEGTTCGNRKWCENGRCVSDSRAPAAAEACHYGDYKGRLFNQDGPTCEDIARNEPYKCYDEYHNGKCCQTCNKIKEAAVNDDCLYGDRVPGHCKNIRRADCYQEDTLKLCCARCASWRVDSKPMCEYGDKASWCNTITPGRCYVESKTCCQTCDRFKTGPEGCEYGDMLSWCRQLSASDCYNGDNARKCCATCKRLQTGPQGCEWGNVHGSCRQEDCKFPSRLQECCRTCSSQFSGGTSTTPVPDTCMDKATFCNTMPARDCYVYENICCRSCKRHVISSTNGCKFGDRVSWCSGYIRSAEDCNRFDVSSQCCQTCKRYPKNPGSGGTTPASTCRDNASWCASITSGMCYNTNVRTTCCKSCDQRKTGLSDCQYGDKFSWCQAKYCQTNARDCCATCR